MSDQGRLAGGRYRLLEILGQGGVGVVWHARDELLDRDVAVKEVVFPRRLPAEERERACARSLREAYSVARLNNPAIVTVHDIIEDDGQSWIVMELFPGQSLADLLASGPLAPGEVARIGAAVLGALADAHEAGVVHRDVKPGNVLVDGDRVALTDFGTASLHEDSAGTGIGWGAGSLAYLSPERADGRPAGPESDLWALGATMYAAVEGRPPYTGEDSGAVLAAMMAHPPPAPKNAGPLKPVLAGLLRRDPARRFTADEAAGQLITAGQLSEAEVTTPPPAGLAPPAGPTPRQRRRRLAVAAVVLLALVGTGAGVLLAQPSKSATAAPVTHATRPALAPTLNPAPTPSPTISSIPVTADTCAGLSGKSSRPTEIGHLQLASGGTVDVAMSPDCAVLAAGADGTVNLLNLAAGQRTLTFVAAPYGGIAVSDAFTPTGRILAVPVTGGSSSGNTTLWNTGTGLAVGSLPSDPDGATYVVAISPDGKVIYTGGSSKYVTAFSLASSGSLHQYSIGEAVGYLALSPNGTWLAIGGLNGEDYLFNADTGKLVRQWNGLKGHVLAMAFAPDNRTLVTGTNDGVLQWWNSTDGKLIAQKSTGGGAVVDVALSPDGTIVAAGGNGVMTLWNAGKHREITSLSLGRGGEPSGLAFTNHGGLLAVGLDGQLELWNVAGVHG
jgi:serine/threonine protein kinase